MFETLFKRPAAIARHKSMPYAEERARFLVHCAKAGYSSSTLAQNASELLLVVHLLDISSAKGVTVDEVKAVANRWGKRQCRRCRASTPRSSRNLFVNVATRWLRFLGRLREPIVQPAPFSKFIEDFAVWMERERGLSPATIKSRRWHLERFFRWYATRSRSISAIRISDIDTFVIGFNAKGYSRRYPGFIAGVIKAFLRYAAGRGWCSKPIAEYIQGSRRYGYEDLPGGLTWGDVNHLLASMETDQAQDVRDRAITMLFAIYGFRSGEVSRLRLEDIDWEHDRISVQRSKDPRYQSYPLMPVVGNAIIRYLRDVRPRCPHREVFLTLQAPFRKLSSGGLYHVTSDRLVAMGIQVPHRGPHMLRHACAMHLVTHGFSLKEIGDHLGHRSLDATRIYAKVDLPRLREVAAFDLGGLS